MQQELGYKARRMRVTLLDGSGIGVQTKKAIGFTSYEMAAILGKP